MASDEKKTSVKTKKTANKTSRKNTSTKKSTKKTTTKKVGKPKKEIAVKVEPIVEEKKEIAVKVEPIVEEEKEIAVKVEPIVEEEKEIAVKVEPPVKYKKVYKLKKRNIITLILFLVFLVVFIISLTHIISWHKDNEDIEKDVKKIKNIVEIKEIENEGNIEIITQPEEIEEFNPYWDYIDMKLINVNFEELKKENSDTVGWIQVNGTKINYPFVQTTDNKYYLTHSFYKKNNSAGWVFLDYRNNISELDKNTLLYAHGRKNNTMFGSLNNILNSKWVKDTDNYVIKLSTEKENTLWQVFSIYHIPTTSDYLQIEFKDNEEFLVFANKLKDRSMYDFNTNVSQDDKILTLSTCLNEQEKTVVHAKLIKREER